MELWGEGISLHFTAREEKVPSKVIEPIPGQLFKTLTVRLPLDMYLQVASLARKERRTLHSQLLVLLEQGLVPFVEGREKSDTPEQ